MYVKVTNGSAEKYTLGLLRRDNPNVSFPKTIPEQTLVDYGIYPLNDTPQPAYNSVTQTITEALTQANGAWYRTWTISDKGAEEVMPLLISQIASDRYNKESSGLIWSDINEVQWFIDTSVESQNRIASVVLTIQTGMRTENSVWKCADTQGNVVFRPTTNAELQQIAGQVQAFVQKCFNAEAAAVDKVLLGDFTTNFETEFLQV